jgi:hypothetical protein
MWRSREQHKEADFMATPTYGDMNFNASGRNTNLLDGVNPQDSATIAQLNAAVEGTNWKDNVRAGSAVNVNLAAPGANIGAVAMAANDRFLAFSQTAGLENGIYIYNGAATPATRAADASTFAELKNAVAVVDEGTFAGSSYRQSVVTGTLGVTALVFGAFLSGSPPSSEATAGILEIATQAETDTGTDDLRAVTPLKLKNSKLFTVSKFFVIGDASATSFNCDHNLNTFNVMVQVRKATGNRDQINVDNITPNANRVTVTFPASFVPAAGEFNVIIQGTPA